MHKPRTRFANIVAVLALVFAIGGGAYAATKINGGDIKTGSIPTKALEKRAVKHGKLAKKSVKGNNLNTGLKNRINRNQPAYFHTTDPGSFLTLGAGGLLEFNGVQVAKKIVPLNDSEFQVKEAGTYRVTLIMTIAEVSAGGGIEFRVDGVPSHLQSGILTAGVNLLLDGLIIMDKNQVLSAVTKTGLEVQLASGTQRMLTVQRVGGPVAPLRIAEGGVEPVDVDTDGDPGAEEPGTEEPAG